MKKRLFVAFLAFAMLLTIVPSALAAEKEAETELDVESLTRQINDSEETLFTEGKDVEFTPPELPQESVYSQENGYNELYPSLSMDQQSAVLGDVMFLEFSTVTYGTGSRYYVMIYKGTDLDEQDYVAEAYGTYPGIVGYIGNFDLQWDTAEFNKGTGTYSIVMFTATKIDGDWYIIEPTMRAVQVYLTYSARSLSDIYLKNENDQIINTITVPMGGRAYFCVAYDPQNTTEDRRADIYYDGHLEHTEFAGLHCLYGKEGGTTTLTVAVNYKSVSIPVTVTDPSGRCGPNVSWSYQSATKTLNIYGTGAMYNYVHDELPWAFFATSIEHVNISQGVTHIGTEAFYGCEALTTVSIPTSVTSIGKYAFYSCRNLTSVKIPEGVTRIEEHTFDLCWNLKTLILPDNLTAVDQCAFSHCRSLKRVFSTGEIKTIGDSAFSECGTGIKLYFWGDAPTTGIDLFQGTGYATMYYNEQASGWTSPFWNLINAIPFNPSYPPAFKDVEEDAWYYDAVCSVTENHLMGGVGTGLFGPDGKMTRAMLVTVLWRYAGEVEVGENIFADVPEGQWYTQAVAWAAYTHVVNGMGENLFQPDGNVTREQMAVILYRYSERIGADTSVAASLSAFPDESKVSDWAKEAMQWAVGEGLIGGTNIGGTAYLDPQGFATRAQVATILMRFVQYVGEQEIPETCWHANTELRDAQEPTCTESGYTGDSYCVDCGELLAQGEEIPATGHSYENGVCTQCGEASHVKETISLTVAENTYHIGMTLTELTALAGQPDETLASAAGYIWYVFGTTDYSDFFAAGVQEEKVVALCAAGKGFSYLGTKMGDSAPVIDHEDCDAVFFTDENDNHIVHAVLLTDPAHWTAGVTSWYYRGNGIYTAETLAGESKMNFHLTNAFRVYHEVGILKWCDKAAEAARLHSLDMATNDYFSHTDLEGGNMGDRLSAQGVHWTSCGENIIAGYYTGLSAYDGWVNSSGHRTNMLRSGYTNLGVGFAIGVSSTYYIYGTQNFYS
ncbi:MAG: leucine-rich repeat protein [Oscillospiraceae bacterium]|nr:leucine-rich repeat protein [Oscillospiraceae bacterium]